MINYMVYKKPISPNGNLARKQQYINGEKNGESFIFADNGQVTKKLNYKEGKLHGPANYYTLKE